MALEGSLKEFNVADILQLIFFQKKTGVLMLNSRQDRVRVLFSDGNIVGAESKKRGFDRKLGMVLLKKGLINKEQIESTVAKQRTEGGKFGAVLVKEGHITKEQLQEVITFQITEVMVQVFSMKEGFYEFKPQSVPVDKDVGVVLNTEHFLMEGVRLLDEWSQIEGQIDLDDIYLRVEPAPNVAVSDEEKKVLALVNGQYTVADITDISGIDSFTVSSGILDLAKKGVVKRLVVEVEKPKETVVAKRDIPGLKGVLYLLIVLAIAVSVYVAGTINREDRKIFKASEEVDALQFSIETEYYKSGSYPESLDALNSANVVDPWDNYYMYESKGNDHVVMTAGPDGLLDTKDDIPRVYKFFTPR
jgi:hypothetical protein